MVHEGTFASATNVGAEEIWMDARAILSFALDERRKAARWDGEWLPRLIPRINGRPTCASNLDADGTALVQCATHDLGTGAYSTAFTQIAADSSRTGPTEKVKFELGNSDLLAGPVAGGSNSDRHRGIRDCESPRKRLGKNWQRWRWPIRNLRFITALTPDDLRLDISGQIGNRNLIKRNLMRLA